MEKFQVPKKLNTILLVFAGIGAVTLAVGFAVDAHRAWAGLLVVAFFIMSLALSGGFFSSLQFVAGASWSVVLRRVPETMMMALPAALVLIIAIIAFGRHDLYHWSHADVVARDPILQAKSDYLDLTWFIIRQVVYFTLWMVMWQIIRKMSLKQDETKDPATRSKLVGWSAAFIIVFAYSYTFASIDLIMSLEPHWYSTMFSIYTFSGMAGSGIAALVILINTIKKNYGLKEVNKEHLHDVGKFIFLFTVFWAYIAFSQFMLIWYANLVEETIYLEIRLFGEWKTFTVAFWILHFVVPFLVLLSSEIKRDFKKLTIVAWYIVFMGFVDIVWIVYGGLYANFHSKTFPFMWMELGLFFGAIGIFGYIVLNSYAKVNMIPKGDPFLEESINFHQTH